MEAKVYSNRLFARCDFIGAHDHASGKATRFQALRCSLSDTVPGSVWPNVKPTGSTLAISPQQAFVVRLVAFCRWYSLGLVQR